ncbi:hypothetical protein B0H14DRAFT_3143756 [Mycena olivaceomarginata]|nr:hypothetical protein B0H14DRAFT_3149185 [Mycena olivaceomarginata]KAJ7829853.1 hypothetical protein B0H14DRAFT_3143756 [Mycena olivaceomarginata]
MESPPTNLHSTIGAYQIGVLISYMCFGVTTTQAYIYYSRFPDDSRKLKALVAFVWLGELGHAICIGHTLYGFTIFDYGHPERFLRPAPKSLVSSMLLGSMAVTAVQVYFAFRLYQLSKKLQIAIVSWTLSFVRQLAALTIFVIALRPIPVAIYDPKWRWLFLIYWSASSTNDLTITGAFAVMLTAQRSHVSARDKDATNVCLTHGPIPESQLTSRFQSLWHGDSGLRMYQFCRLSPLLDSILKVVLQYVANSENFIWLGMFAISTRMYATCFLASLIYRTTLRTMDEVPMSFSSAATEPSSNVQITKELEFAHFDSSRGQLSGASPRQ